ncbi:MAG: DUF4440 domain-containing protein [Crocinitomicaceae bacterium]|nr:DUF4440 domain-containing protein [Crocinitomicaceae bacterium]|tara:strand:- start:15855 stop:16220 length:366 start_codon:yes stop_codon:yes gene_type:complete
MSENQINELEDRLLQAMKSSDLTELDTLLHDDLLFILPGGQPITKNMDLQTYRSKDFELSEISSADRVINRIGENAVVTQKVTMAGKYIDHSIDGDYRFIRVWKNVSDQWKVIAGSSCHLG